MRATFIPDQIIYRSKYNDTKIKNFTFGYFISSNQEVKQLKPYQSNEFFFAYIFQDWKANRGNVKARLVLVMFRLVNALNKYRVLKVLFFWYLIIYRFFVEWVLGVELPRKLTVGKNLVFYHGQGLVVNFKTVIGDNCTLRNGVTIGHKSLADGSLSACPVIGNHVDIGANVCIIGAVTIGDNVTIGAGAVVVKSIPANSVAVGNPARILENKAEAVTRI